MADDADRADSEMAAHQRAWQINRDRAASGPSTDICCDCGEPIPRKRLEAMKKSALPCYRCLPCQQRIETIEKGYR